MPGNSGAGVFGVVNGIDDEYLIIGQPVLFITCMHMQILRHGGQLGNN